MPYLIEHTNSPGSGTVGIHHLGVLCLTALCLLALPNPPPPPPPPLPHHHHHHHHHRRRRLAQSMVCSWRPEHAGGRGGRGGGAYWHGQGVQPAVGLHAAARIRARHLEIQAASPHQQGPCRGACHRRSRRRPHRIQPEPALHAVSGDNLPHDSSGLSSFSLPWFSGAGPR